jgi:hypothetical protein
MRGFLFLIPIILICLGIEYYNKTRIGNNVIAKLQLIETYGDSLNTLIIGNSHGRNGLVSKEFNGSCINVSIGGSSVFYSKEVFKRVLDKNKSGSLKNLILTVSYQTLFKDLKGSSTEDKRYEFYHYLGADLDLPKSFDLRKYSIIKTISFHAAAKNIWNDLRGNPTKVYDNFGYTPSTKRVDSMAVMTKATERISIHHDLMSKEPLFLKESLEDLEVILKMATERNINVFVVTTPVTPAYYSLEIEPYKHFSQKVDSLTNLYSFRYIDYNQRDILKDSKYFKDSDHLNKWGAEIFTAEVKKDFNL